MTAPTATPPALARTPVDAPLAGASARNSGETPAGSDAAATGTGTTATTEMLYLIGRPSLKEFLRFVSGHAVHPLDEGVLVDRWNAARRLVATLQTTEAGAANDTTTTKLGPEYTGLLMDFLRDPLVQHGFNTVPTEVAMVELDRLVVYQEHIDVSFADDLARRLGPNPSNDAIFRTCLPFDHPLPPVRWSRMHGDKYVFLSPSNDLRYLGTMPLQDSNIHDHTPPGSLVGVVGAAIGFGSNFMNAVRSEGRLVLNNGSHRAYALRRMGITHAPCIVQHCATRDEMEVVASSQVRRHPDLYFKTARPPMLRDYLDPRLRFLTTVFRRLRQVTVRVDISEDFVPVF